LKLFIYGAGGHAKVVAESAISLERISEISFIDDNNKNKSFISKNPNFSFISESDIPDDLNDLSAIVGIGDNQIRESVVKRCSRIPFISITSPYAMVSESAEISSGSFISSGAIINADSFIGSHTIINSGSIIEHDCSIGNFCHIGPNAAIAGGVKLDANVFIGGGAYVNPNVSICNNVTLGSGSLVIHDIQEPGTYVGFPLKKLK